MARGGCRTEAAAEELPAPPPNPEGTEEVAVDEEFVEDPDEVAALAEAAQKLEKQRLQKEEQKKKQQEEQSGLRSSTDRGGANGSGSAK